jgi:hypothetical protein
MGRPSPLEVTPRIQQALVKQIERGVPIRHACANAGIDDATFHRWIQKADPCEDDGVVEEMRARYRDFRDAIAHARAKKIDRLLARLEQASKIPSAATGQLDWRATAWLLERTEPNDFGPRSKVESEVDANVKVTETSKARVTQMIESLVSNLQAAGIAPKHDEETSDREG